MAQRNACTIELYFISLYDICSINTATMNRIKEVLENKGISQTWLAKQLGKSFCMVNAYACNRRQPNLELLFEIAKILEVDVKELIESKEEK